MGLSYSFARRSLRDDQLAWIRDLPTTLNLVEDVLLVHRTPESDLSYFLDM
jgi:hypothetical protein